MKPQDLVNRTVNLVATTVLGLSAFSFLPELFIETEHPYKIDEALLFILGIVLIGWYLKGKNKFQRSIFPIIMVWAGLAVKIMGVVIEFKDKEDLGDDMGALILFLLASLLVTYLYIKAKNFLAEK